MKQSAISPVIVLPPGDRLNIEHRISVLQNLPREIAVVGIRWELVTAEDLTAEELAMLERDAVMEVTV